MITTLLVIGIVWAYLFFGCISHRLTLRHGQRQNWDDGDKEIVPFIAGFFWPIALAYWAIVIPVGATLRFTNKMVGFIFSVPERVSARKNRVALPVAKLVK